MTRRTAVVAISACSAACAHAADGDLRLTLSCAQNRYIEGEPIVVHWKVDNVRRAAVNVVAFHQAGAQPQFDELQVWVSANGGPNREVPMVGPRAAVRAVWKELGPGASLDQEFDLVEAAGAGGLRFSPGDYRVTAAYSLHGARSEAGAPAWEGTARTAAPLGITIGRR
jgi:hypothetical protein